MQKTVSLIGLGWFGSAFAETMAGDYKILGTTRSGTKLEALKQHGYEVELLTTPHAPSASLLKAETIIINIPPFGGQLDWFKTWEWNLHSHIIFISSTSVYGELIGPVNEATQPSPTTENAKELILCENWFASFPHATIIRFGGLLGKSRHPGNILSGKKNLKGPNEPVNLIHLDDAIGFTKLVMEKRIVQETFNLVSPRHPTRKEFYQGYCLKKKLELPEFLDDSSEGKTVSHEKVSKLYQFQNHLM